MTQENNTPALDFEARAFIAASGQVLCEHLPSDFNERSEDEMDQFVVVNAWQPFEHWPAKEIWSQIDSVATSLKDFYKNEISMAVEQLDGNKNVNEKRAEIAFKAIQTHGLHTGNLNEEMEDKIKDLLCDLRHLAGQYGVDFDSCVESSSKSYNEEIGEA